MGMLGMGVWLATWMLVGQVAMQPCTGAGCQALPGVGTVTQDVRAFPSFEACERTRQQMVKTVGRHTTTMQVTDPQTGQPATARHAMVWACQPGASE
jgi:hypothetical protein